MQAGWKVVGSVIALSALLVTAPALAEDTTVFYGENELAEAWVSVDLARHRTEEPYAPFLVVVRCRGGEPAELDRSSFRMLAADGTADELPSIEEVRESYKKISFDMSMVRFFGIPIGTRLDMSRVIPSNFFPPVGAGTGVRIDDIAIPNGYWIVDLLYFPWPDGLQDDRPAVLEIDAEEWETPLRVKLEL
jgi:hypothetical protein